MPSAISPARPRIRLLRAQIGHRPGVDITVKSAVGGLRAFAPTWDMVRSHKNGSLSDEDYTKRYLTQLNTLTRTDWILLRDAARASAGELCLLCYCRDSWFCHTHLLIDYLLNRWPDSFEDARSLLPALGSSEVPEALL